MRKTRIIPALVAAAVLAVPAAANANWNVNNDGTGFVGKGDVQTALGYNNAQMQANVNSLTFTLKQVFTQSATEAGAVQSGTQSGSQSVTQDLSCTINGKNKSFHRDGSRVAMRDASRNGSRTGTRTGVRSGKLVSDIAYEARKMNQYTGFNLKGWAAGSPVTRTDDIVWGQYSFGDWSFGDWSVNTDDAIEWGDWQAEPGENPADCDRTDTIQGVPVVSDYKSVITEGATEATGDVQPGDITAGDVTAGEKVFDPATLSVNGVVMPNAAL